MTQLVQRFGTTPERVGILNGLLAYRGVLSSLAISDGLQWLDGSFVEDVENKRGRPPGDIDIVTLARRPPTIATATDWEAFVDGHPEVFDPVQTKAEFKCDAYYIDLDLLPELVVGGVIYYFGLFSHQRVTSLWKGMIAVPLISDDDVAQLLLES